MKPRVPTFLKEVFLLDASIRLWWKELLDEITFQITFWIFHFQTIIKAWFLISTKMVVIKAVKKLPVTQGVRNEQVLWERFNQLLLRYSIFIF